MFTGCIKCKELKATFAKVATEHESKFGILAAYDMSKAQELANLFGVENLPVLKYIREGNPVTDYDGKLTDKDLQDFIQNMKSIKKDEL